MRIRAPDPELIQARNRLPDRGGDAKDARLDDRRHPAVGRGDERVERGEDAGIGVGRDRRILVPAPERDHAVGESPSFKGSYSAGAPLTSAARTRFRYSCDLSISVCSDVMVSLIALFPAFILWLPNVIWKLFEMFIGLIQAFIFALLTILYFSSVRPAHEVAHAPESDVA